jgi:hypothetical protein
VGLGLIKPENTAVSGGKGNKAKMVALDRAAEPDALPAIYTILLHACSQGATGPLLQSPAWSRKLVWRVFVGSPAHARAHTTSTAYFASDKKTIAALASDASLQERAKQPCHAFLLRGPYMQPQHPVNALRQKLVALAGVA